MPKLRLLVVIALCACGSKSSEPVLEKPAAAVVAAPAPAQPAQVEAGGLTWTSQAPLVARAPKSRMRAAEYGLSSDPDAELSVFYFGEGQGGAVDANIARWLGQLGQPDGSDTAQKAKRSERTVGNVTVALVEATGNYAGGMAMPGAPAPAPITDAMMLGAIANGPKGPVFFKLIGKRASVEAARAAFAALLSSLRPAS
jgi:predicted small lipoprotein YifL